MGYSVSDLSPALHSGRTHVCQVLELTRGVCAAEDRVVFVTGGAGTICSAQTRALVHLGANACIIGRNVEKTEKAAKDIAGVRDGAKVIGIGGVDVRSVRRVNGSSVCSFDCSRLECNMLTDEFD